MNDELTNFDEWECDGCSYQLQLSSDETECWLSVIPDGKLEVFEDTLVNLLKEHGVIVGIEFDIVTKCCEAIAANEKVVCELIAEGTKPMEVVDASVEFLVRVSTSVPSYEVVEDEPVDFHQANLFENVHAGQLIGKILPEVLGMGGQSVRGWPIPIPEHKNVRIKFGAGVELRNKDELLATLDGRVVYEDSKVSVTNELKICRDVDYEVGNIDFVGFVHVCGSVGSGFKVRARQGLVVDQVVEHCHIESDGDIQLGGMTGQDDQGIIKCGGNLTAKYLHDVRVECQGDIDVKSEIMNSVVYSCGTITAALIAGGKTVALKGLEVKTLGSDGRVKTFLEVGIDYRFRSDVKHLFKQLIYLRDQLQKISEEIKEPNHDHELLSKRKILLEDQKEKLLEVQQSTFNSLGESANAKVNIKKTIYDGVIIRLGNVEQQIHEDRNGGCSIIEHRGENLVFTRLTPLYINAREIEQQLVDKENEDENE